MKYVLVIISMLFFASTNAQEPKADKYANRRHFVLFFTPGDHWEKDKPMSQQKLEAHRAYYQDLMNKGQVVIGGGFLDKDNGMSILKVKNIEEANEIVTNDPAVISGIFTIEVRPFFAAFKGRNEEQIDLTGLIFKKQ